MPLRTGIIKFCVVVSSLSYDNILRDGPRTELTLVVLWTLTSVPVPFLFAQSTLESTVSIYLVVFGVALAHLALLETDIIAPILTNVK